MTNKLRVTFGQHLKATRKASNIKVDTLTLTKSQVSLIENGNANPTLDNLLILAEEMNCELKFVPKQNNNMQDLQNFVINEFIANSFAAFQKNLNQYLKNNLEKLGFKFKDDLELVEFLKKRAKRVNVEGEPKSYYEIYIDFVDENNKGIFIGCYSDNAELTQIGGLEVKMNIGI